MMTSSRAVFANFLALGMAVAAAAATGCSGSVTEERARAVAADIEASIQNFDGPALNQNLDVATVIEIQNNLTALKEFMGEVDGEIDQVLVNAIQEFQRKQNQAIPWWRAWERSPNDGLVTKDLRQAIATAAAAA